MESIKITLETLYDILRNEKKREDLQKLESTFYLDVVNYLKEKIEFLERRKHDHDLFASGERDKLEYELRSIRRILKETYEKREKKIIDIAMNKSRTGSDIIDISAMLPEEKEFYYQMLKNLDDFRRGILLNLFKGEQPAIENITLTRYQPAEPQIKNEAPKIKEIPPEVAPEIKKARIRFLRPVPSFVWKDMKIYGPYETGEEIEIFSEVADLLVRKGRAEKILE